MELLTLHLCSVCAGGRSSIHSFIENTMVLACTFIQRRGHSSASTLTCAAGREWVEWEQLFQCPWVLLVNLGSNTFLVLCCPPGGNSLGLRGD